MAYLRCFSTLGCPDLSLPECLALAERHGLAGIELRALGGTIDLPKYLQGQFGTPERMAQMLRNVETRVLVVDTSLRLADSSPEDRRKFLEFVPWAEAAGAKWLRIFDGPCRRNTPGAVEAVDTLRWWQSMRQLHGWRVDCMVETHDGLLDTPAILDFLHAAPGTRLLWDAHNTWRAGAGEPLATWRAIRHAVVHIHVKDSTSQPNRGVPYTYVPPGQGEFPMGPLAAALRAEFTGAVSLESERLWHPDLPALDELLHAARAAAWW